MYEIGIFKVVLVSLNYKIYVCCKVMLAFYSDSDYVEGGPDFRDSLIDLIAVNGILTRANSNIRIFDIESVMHTSNIRILTSNI